MMIAIQTAEREASALAPLPDTPPDRNPAIVYCSGLADGNGRKSQATALERFAADLTAGHCTAKTLPWQQLTYAHVAAVRTVWLDSEAAPATVNARLSAVRGAVKAAWRLGLIDTDRYQRIADVPNVKGSRLPAGRSLDTGELSALFRACAKDPSPAGCRDAALFAVMYGTGLRRAELTALKLSDWNQAAGCLTVIGKGNKERALPISNGTLSALLAWLDVRGPADGPLFNRIDRHGNLDASKPMSGQAVANRIKTRAAQADIAHCSPHDFRRSHVSDALDNGADLAAVAANAGHANPQTTMRYDRRGFAAQRKAAAAVHVPFVRSPRQARIHA